MFDFSPVSKEHDSSIGAARNEKKCSVPRLGLLHFQRYPPAIGGDHTPAQMVVSNFWPQNAISLPGASSKNEKLKVGLYLRRCRPNEVSEADYAKAKQRNHNIIFEFLKHFCKFSFYDFHFIPFGLGAPLRI